MTAWKMRRFWTEARAVASGGGFAVELDGRPVRTPAKARLMVPTGALARAIADEWQAQAGAVDPRAMPVTRAANAAIDKVSVQFDEVAGMIAAYGDSDLTCYRAAAPEALVGRQAAAWDPLLDWAADTFGARLIPVQGVIHQPQPRAALDALAAPVRALDPFELTALHDLVSLSGSLVIGLAASEAVLPVETLWDRSRIDEDWQVEQWGEDDEAAAEAGNRRRGFLDAARFLRLARERP